MELIEFENNECEESIGSKIWFPPENIPISLKRYLFENDKIPNFKKLHLQCFYPALGQLLRLPDYQMNYATFWFLDIIADLLRNAQLKFHMKKRNQKALVEWFIYCYDLLRMYGVSRKYLLETFHKIVMKDNFWEFMNFAVPGPHDLGLIPDDEDDKHEEQEKEENIKIIKDSNIYEDEEGEESDDEPPYTCETNAKDLGNIISSLYSIYGEEMIYEMFKEIVEKELKTCKLQFPYSLCVPRPLEQPPPPPVGEEAKSLKKGKKKKEKEKMNKKDKQGKKRAKLESKISLQIEQEEEEEEEKIKIPMIQCLQNSTTLTEEWFQKHFPVIEEPIEINMEKKNKKKKHK